MEHPGKFLKRKYVVRSIRGKQTRTHFPADSLMLFSYEKFGFPQRIGTFHATLSLERNANLPGLWKLRTYRRSYKMGRRPSDGHWTVVNFVYDWQSNGFRCCDSPPNCRHEPASSAPSLGVSKNLASGGNRMRSLRWGEIDHPS